MLVSLISAQTLSLSQQRTSVQGNSPEPDTSPNLAHVAAPPPTDFLKQLLSPDAEVRVKALKLVDVTPLFLKVKALDGEDRTRVSQARLLYGRYREDGDLAIVAVQLHEFTWASVLLHSSSGWERIGRFSCWCKYESNPLEGFVEFRSVLGSPATEIIAHDSGGGSGFWARFLTLFRLQNGRLEKIFDTTDKATDCHPTQNKDYCTLIQARIEYQNFNTTPALVLTRLESIERVPRIPSSEQSPAWSPPLLEVFQNVRRVGCEILLWDGAKRSFAGSRRWTSLYCRASTPGPR